MFIPMWLIIVIVLLAVFYVYGVKATHKDNEHKIKSHLDSLKSEANFAEIYLARSFYDLAWKMIMHKNHHASDVLKILKENRDYTALAIGEKFLYNPNEYQEEVNDIINDIKQNTGFDITTHNKEESPSQYYDEWVTKYNDKVSEIRLMMDIVSKEIE